jgi:hypothetical protein
MIGKNQCVPFVRETHTSKLQEFLIDSWIFLDLKQQKQWKERNKRKEK